MKKQTLFLVAIGVIAVVAVIVGITWHHETGQSPQNSTAPTSTPPGISTSSSITYTNYIYGFTFSLPGDWQGYSIVTSTWHGNGDEACPAAGCPSVTGPEIIIRNPNWTKTDPFQDIPIMVFTPSEWNAVASGTLAVSAAPIPPTELGENASYVFALPARYNYAYPNGWQEVQSIMQSDPLHAFAVSALSSTPSSSLGYFNGKQICKTDADCPASDDCTVAGPILANQPTPATCWPKGQAVPL